MGIPDRRRGPRIDSGRDADIIELYSDGNTLQKIGSIYGVSRERIRQILKRNGFTRKDGGESVKAAPNKLAVQARRDSFWIDKYGCDYEATKQYRTEYPKATAQYRSQKNNAARRNIEWQMTFAEWIKIWIESGHYHERGLGIGKYVMCRIGDKGPYAPGNVEIGLSTENSRQGIQVAFRNGLIKKKYTHCRRGHELTKENIYHWRGARQCKKCIVIRSKAYYERKKVAALGRAFPPE